VSVVWAVEVVPLGARNDACSSTASRLWRCLPVHPCPLDRGCRRRCFFWIPIRLLLLILRRFFAAAFFAFTAAEQPDGEPFEAGGHGEELPGAEGGGEHGGGGGQRGGGLSELAAEGFGGAAELLSGAFDGGRREGPFQGGAEQFFGVGGPELFEEAAGELGEPAELLGFAGGGEQRGDELVEAEGVERFGELLLGFASEDTAERCAEQPAQLAFEGGEQAGEGREFADRRGGTELLDGFGEAFSTPRRPSCSFPSSPTCNWARTLISSRPAR
jgi:hypothetical protein